MMMLTLQPLCTLYTVAKLPGFVGQILWLSKVLKVPPSIRTGPCWFKVHFTMEQTSAGQKKNTFNTRPNIDSEVVLGVFVSNSSFDFSVQDKMLEQFCLRGQWASCDRLCWKSSTIHADPTMSCEKPSNSYSWPPWHLLIGFIIRTRSRSDWQ